MDLFWCFNFVRSGLVACWFESLVANSQWRSIPKAPSIRTLLMVIYPPLRVQRSNLMTWVVFGNAIKCYLLESSSILPSLEFHQPIDSLQFVLFANGRINLINKSPLWITYWKEILFEVHWSLLYLANRFSHSTKDRAPFAPKTCETHAFWFPQSILEHKELASYWPTCQSSIYWCSLHHNEQIYFPMPLCYCTRKTSPWIPINKNCLQSSDSMSWRSKEGSFIPMFVFCFLFFGIATKLLVFFKKKTRDLPPQTIIFNLARVKN